MTNFKSILSEKTQKILDKCGEGKYIFRGERECYDKVTSNLYRYYSKLYEDKECELKDDFPVSKLEKEIVDRARRHVRLDAPNIEVLTQLQHHGGKTALIDFTQDLYVALFFACNGNFDKNGRIILLNTSGMTEQTDIDYDKENLYTLIFPVGKDPRVVFQSSVFLHASRGYIERNRYEVFEIEKDLKEGLLDCLRKYFGIGTDSIYNDIQGFIKNEENYPDAEAEFYLGVGLHGENQPSAAIEHYSAAIRLKPEFAEAYFNRAIAKADLGMFSEAIEDYDRAIESRPKFVKAYVNRGHIKTRLGRLKEAVGDFDQASRLSSEHVEAYTNRGHALTLLGRHEEAIEDYNRAIELKPEEETYNNRGITKVKLGYPEEGLKDFDKAIDMNPKSAKAHYNRGLARLAMGGPEEAIEDFGKAAELRPDHCETYVNLGSLKTGLGRYEEAIEDLNRAIEINPKCVKAYHNRGTAKYAMGRLEEAEKDFVRARELKAPVEV